MGALLEITIAFIVAMVGWIGVLNTSTGANEIAYINRDASIMQSHLTDIKLYCITNTSGGTPCTPVGGTVLATGALPTTLAGYWTFAPMDAKTGTAFNVNVTAGTNCVSLDSPAQYLGQYLPDSIPVLDNTGALTAKVATTKYYLHADDTKGGVFATATATSTPGTC